MTAKPCAWCKGPVDLDDHEVALLAEFKAEPLCDDCNAKDEARVGEWLRDVQARELGRRTEEVRARLIAAGCPQKLVGLMGAMRNHPAQVEARAAVNAWGLQQPTVETTVTLVGTVGTGKTVLAVMGLGVHAMQGRHVAWVRASRLASAAMSDDTRVRQSVDRLLEAQYRKALVIDDLDKVRATDYGGSLIFDLVDGWHHNGWPLLVTANTPLKGLAARYEGHGEAIADRLGEGTTVQITGPSHRTGN